MVTAMIVTGLASIIIGDTIGKNSTKHRDTTRAIIVLLFIRIISDLAIYLGLNPNDLKLITAVIIISFIAYNNYLARAKHKKLVKMLEIKNISKSFNIGTLEQVTIFDNFTLKIEEGVATTTISPNGCGKSTLMNIISGSISVVGGNILIAGEDVTHLSEEKRALI